MEFQNPWEEFSDDDETLSFCDLVTEQGVEEFVLRDSNTESLDHEGFGFDFDFGRCGSKTDHVFPADDLFRHGFLLPLTDSVQYSSFEKSNSENLLAWRNDSVHSQPSFYPTSNSSRKKTESCEILRRSNSKSKGNRKPEAWRNDSLDLRFSVWPTLSQRKTHSGEILRRGNSKSKGNYKPPASGGKMSAKWRSLSLKLMETPPMRLEDMRLRQGKTKNNINGAKNLDLRRSASCDYYKDQKLEEKEAKAVNLEEKCRSEKENVVVKKTAWFKGWKELARCATLKNCKASNKKSAPLWGKKYRYSSSRFQKEAGLLSLTTEEICSDGRGKVEVCIGKLLRCPKRSFRLVCDTFFCRH